MNEHLMMCSQSLIIITASMVRNNEPVLSSSSLPPQILQEILESFRNHFVS